MAAPGTPAQKSFQQGLNAGAAKTTRVVGGIREYAHKEAENGSVLWKLIDAVLSVGDSEEQAADGLSTGASEEKPSLLDPQGEHHVLEGDGPNAGGGHRSGTGKPGKSEFPANWSDDKINGEISDVATDPGSTRTTQPNGRIKIQGTRDGVDITVIVEPDRKGGRIVTGFPTNTPRNP
jgi:hypothetical protein